MESIYRQYNRAVYAYLMRLCANEDLARELTQETFYQATKSIDRFDGRSAVNTWLCSIAKHLLYDALRRQRPTEPLTQDMPSPEDFTQVLIQKDEAMTAHRLLHMLEEPYREVFTLRTFCELSHAQIAGLFGKSPAWSRVTYYRARCMLQEAMKENENEKE